ncbi:MAG: alpha/beta hydrolase [Pseudomonadales bacterium]|nr:alpha/beta hydrolase [Pseudomonadales bacterium]
MPSQESKYLETLYQDWAARMAAEPEMTMEGLRSLFDEWEKATLEPEEVTYKSDNVAGINVIWALPVGADKSKVLLYTHGGGFAVGSASSHRKLAGHMAKALGTTSIVLDYRLAPENPYPAQIEDAVAVYQALLSQGIKPENVTTIGDSAGGNLAVSSVLKFRELDLPLPGSVIAFSPWLDMALTGDTLATNEATDLLVQRPILESMAEMFLGESGKVDDPLTSPLLADFTGFPPLYTTAGSVETLLSDSQRLHAKATAAGVNSTLSIVEGMQHVFPFLAGRAPEADGEIAKIAKWFKAL